MSLRGQSPVSGSYLSACVRLGLAGLAVCRYTRCVVYNERNT